MAHTRIKLLLLSYAFGLLLQQSAEAKNLWEVTELILANKESRTSAENSFNCGGIVSYDFQVTKDAGKGFVQLWSGNIPGGLPPCICRLAVDNAVQAAANYTKLFQEFVGGSSNWSLRCYNTSPNGIVMNGFVADGLTIETVPELQRRRFR